MERQNQNMSIHFKRFAVRSFPDRCASVSRPLSDQSALARW